MLSTHCTGEVGDVQAQSTNDETPKAMARYSNIRPMRTATPNGMTDILVAGTARVTAYSGGMATHAERKTMGTPHRCSPRSPSSRSDQALSLVRTRPAGLRGRSRRSRSRRTGAGTTAPAESEYGADLANGLSDGAADRCRDLLGEPTDLRRDDVDLAVEDRYHRGQQAVPDRDDELISGRQFTPTPSSRPSTRHGGISRLSLRRHFATDCPDERGRPGLISHLRPAQLHPLPFDRSSLSRVSARQS
jgi:hypothetical protein